MKVSKEVKVGLFMTSAIVLLYFGFSFLKGIDFFSTDKRYYAIFTNIDKLTASNPIYLNGYSVGRVGDIIIQQDKNRVIVELSIDSEIIVTESSVAVLNGELLGGRFIQLVVGNAKTRVLENKDTIRTEVAKGLTDVITENAQPVAANLKTTLAKVNLILDTLGTSAAHLNTILKSLSRTPQQVNSAISSIRGNVGELTSTFNSVGGNLNGTLDSLKPTLANFKTLSDSLKMIQLNGTLQKAQLAITNLNATLSQLSKGDNTASKLLTEDSLYNNLNSLLYNLDSVVNHFNENPRHFMAPLGKSRKKIQREIEKQRKEDNKTN
jgi:phospholipid/cholesterol/gamma-HCH transport system substrate-binding protein